MATALAVAPRVLALTIAALVSVLSPGAEPAARDSPDGTGIHGADDPHVRVADPALSAFAELVSARSPAFRELLQALADSNVVVHVRRDSTLPEHVAGGLSFLTVAGGHRHVLVTIRAQLPPKQLAATLAHELWHALEVAGMPAVVDQPSLVTAYTQIGFPARHHALALFETKAAPQFARRVKEEFTRSAPRRKLALRR